MKTSANSALSESDGRGSGIQFEPMVTTGDEAASPARYEADRERHRQAAAVVSVPIMEVASPDARILDAYEEIRAAKAFVYSFDGVPDDQAPITEMDAHEKRQHDA